jgi:hypothetical protein
MHSVTLVPISLWTVVKSQPDKREPVSPNNNTHVCFVKGMTGSIVVFLLDLLPIPLLLKPQRWFNGLRGSLEGGRS